MLSAQIYRPRILAYCLAVLLVVCEIGVAAADVLIYVLLLLYPFAADWCCRGHAADWARYSLLLDGLLVGVIISLVDFHPWITLALVSAVISSTLLIAPPFLLALNLTLTVAAAVIIGEPMEYAMTLTESLSALFVVCFSAVIAYLGFNHTTRLDSEQRRSKASQERLTRIQNGLQAYVPSNLVRSIEEKQLATRRIFVTVFFSDLEGFTGLMDRLPEHQVTLVLNEYLEAMSNLAEQFGGTVDKFIGDGMMVLFGMGNTSHQEAAYRCVCMALAMRSEMLTLRRRWLSNGKPGDLNVRMGIHSGYCAVGSFGSASRSDYTAVGNVVNLASRLEGQAGRNEILVSAQTWDLVRGRVNGVCGGELQLKGISEPVRVFRIGSAKTSDARAQAQMLA